MTIPKDIRDRFGLNPDTEIEFRVVEGTILIEKAPRKLDLRKWKGRCAASLAELGSSQGKRASVDCFLEDVRGR